MSSSLDEETIKICAKMILEDKVNPEALAVLVADLEREFSHHRY